MVIGKVHFSSTFKDMWPLVATPILTIRNYVLPSSEILTPKSFECYMFIGLIPIDGVALKENVTVHVAISTIYLTLPFAGITFAIACLVFNFIHRDKK